MPDDIPRFFLVNPVDTGFFITNPFNSPRSYANGRHEGIDIRAIQAGKPVDVVAAQRGVIDRIRKGSTGYGNYVRIRHDWPDGTTWVTWYAHLSAFHPTLAVGQEVEIGHRLGVAGTTGNSTAVHLHLTLQHLGHGLSGYVVPDVVDPTRFFTDVTRPLIDELTFLADVTVPDGAMLEAGRAFTKTWRIRNTGTSTWGEGYFLFHTGGDRMGGPERVALPALRPDEAGEVSVELVAPQTPGRHRTTWKSRNPRERAFAFELYADFVVTPIARRDDAVFITHVTLPDGASVPAGRPFVKTWRLRNTGDTPWDTGFALAHLRDERMAATARLALPLVRPGATADLSVAFVAPAQPGVYRSAWQLQNAAARRFGPELQATVRVVAASGQTRYAAAYVADITVLDGTRMAPGYRFTKTWRIRNTGEQPWTEGFVLAHVGDHVLGGPNSVALPPAAPGDAVDVSVAMIAPTTPGHFRSLWQPQTPDGVPFGDILYTTIEVVRLGIYDDAELTAEVTFPAGTFVAGGSAMSKTWRLRNTGSSSWSSGYALVFAGDQQMDGPDSVPLPAALPGEEVEVCVPLVAPRAPGTHRSTWRPRNPSGQLFGPLCVNEIRVPVATTPGSTSVDDAQLEEHVTVPDGAEVGAGTDFRKTWAIRNTGATHWREGYELVFTGGTEMTATRSVPVIDVPPMGIAEVTLDLRAPDEPGRYVGRWRMRNAHREYFGTTFFVSVNVVATLTKFDLLPYLRGDGRLYEMKHIFEMPNGPLIGQQRVQTQTEGRRFYTVKNSEWEELWADDRYIYRGTDTSPGSGNFYTLMDGERYGSAWLPRHMSVGQSYRRSVIVTSRRKGNCVMNSHLSGRHITWIQLEAVHNALVLPDVEGRPGRGMKIQDVAVLAAYNERNGRPVESPFERYYYAKGFGLVMWQGIAVDHRGVSFLVQLHNPGDRPDNSRERIPCLDALRPDNL